MTLPNSVRRLSAKQISIGELRDAVRAVAKGTFAGGSVCKAADRLIDQAETDSVDSDLVVNDGDLVLDELHTGTKPFLGLLVVHGNLTVKGLYRDSLDPDSIVIVSGDLRAKRLISAGYLEVHGSIIVEREALWLGNDGCGEIFGDLRAGFLYTKYHAVKVHGGVVAPLVLGDDARFVSASMYDFVMETHKKHKAALLAALPREVFSFEGDPDEDGDDWSVDYVKHDVLAKLVTANVPVLHGPWPPKSGK